MPPHGCDVGALRVARRVEAETFGLVAVRTRFGDMGGSVPPCCRRILELGTGGVAVKVDLCPLAGLPLGRGGLCQVGDGHSEREDMRSDHGVENFWKIQNTIDCCVFLFFCPLKPRETRVLMVLMGGESLSFKRSNTT